MGYSATVSLEVWENVKKYFAEHLKQYQLVDVMRASKHPDDHYLYMVIARKRDKKATGPWACWTCWNETTQSLNFGHYGIDKYDDAVKICLDMMHNK